MLAICTATFAGVVWIYGLMNSKTIKDVDYQRPRRLVSIGLPLVALLANVAIVLVAFLVDSTRGMWFGLAGIIFALGARLGYMARPKRGERR